jgi:hypothetical protein
MPSDWLLEFGDLSFGIIFHPLRSPLPGEHPVGSLYYATHTSLSLLALNICFTFDTNTFTFTFTFYLLFLISYLLSIRANEVT